MRSSAAAGVACLLFAFPAASQESKPQVPRVMTTGTATVKVPAERARLTIGVTAKAPKAKDAGAKAAALMNAVRDALVALGFDRSALLSAGYSVSAQEDPESRAIRTYAAASSLSAELKDLSQLGTVVDAVLAAGATDVSEIEFTAKDPEAARDKALEKAFRQARRDAEVLARAAGRPLGVLLLASTEHAIGYAASKVMMSAGRAMGGTEITAPEVSVNATVRAEWLIDFGSVEKR